MIKLKVSRIKELEEKVKTVEEKIKSIEEEMYNEEIAPQEYDECRYEIVPMEEFYKEDVKNNNAFIITDKRGEVKVKDKGGERKGQRCENGIYSPKYGSIWQDENAFKELYSCECGKLQGKMFLGMTCPNCGSTVIFKDKNIDMTGYFYLKNYSVIHPKLFSIIASLIGRKKLINILFPDWYTDATGITHPPIIDEKSKSPDKYDNIGMIEFEKRFDEIIDFFQKKKHKDDIYQLIKDNRNAVFTKYLPVESLILRPIVMDDEDYNFSPINTDYNILSSKIYSLNNKYSEISEVNAKYVNKMLIQIQLRYESIVDKIQKTMDKKKGLIRNNIHGSRYNHTVRGVITPMPNGKINETDFPYLFFLIMYKPEIIYLLTILSNITINEAYIEWREGLVKFSKKIYSIMNYLCTNYNIYILLNRNPTLNYGSMMRIRIRRVKKKYDDITIGLPVNDCGAFTADYDGDALNCISLKDQELVDAYELYDPRLHMIISKNDGLFDNSFNLIKDQVICLNQFAKLGNKPTVVKLKRKHDDTRTLKIKRVSNKRVVKIKRI